MSAFTAFKIFMFYGGYGLHGPAAIRRCPLSGSFGGNGQSDILFHNASGQNLIWVVQNDELVGGYSLPQTPTSRSVAGVGDFTGSGTDGTLH